MRLSPIQELAEKIEGMDSQTAGLIVSGSIPDLLEKEGRIANEFKIWCDDNQQAICEMNGRYLTENELWAAFLKGWTYAI